LGASRIQTVVPESETKEVFFNDEKTARLELCGAENEQFK